MKQVGPRWGPSADQRPFSKVKKTGQQSGLSDIKVDKSIFCCLFSPSFSHFYPFLVFFWGHFIGKFWGS